MGEKVSTEIGDVQKDVMEALAGRLLSRATGTAPGYLLINPCSFARRVALELDEVKSPLPIGGPLKACQVGSGGEKTKVVVEIPALGFAWLPQAGPPGTPAQTVKTKLADETHVRNEFFEVEIDPATGGLRGIYDHRTRINRIGQQLVYNPGSVMRVKSIKVNSTGPALGEVVSEGALLDEQGQTARHLSPALPAPGSADRCSTCASRSSRRTRRSAIPGTPTTVPASPGATSAPCSFAASAAPAT